jgi:sugar lactone lactonase YvrE
MNKRFALVGIVAALMPISTATAVSAHGGHDQHPETIDLPAGFVGEGVAVGGHNTFYAGSVADGRIARGNLPDGVSEVFVSTPLVAAATGLKADTRHNLLWVSGAATGQAAVYNLKTGEPVVALTLTTTTPAFINDVVVTRNAAYFTNSNSPEIYRVPVSRHGEVGAPETIALSGPAAEFVDGFNINGIDATKDGRTLIAVNSAKGELYTIDAKTGESALIDLGGVTVPTGDGILLDGKTLYVLQNGNSPTPTPNQIVVIRLRHHLTEGRVEDAITSPLFETATTLAKKGDLLVAVNAQFGGAPIDPESELVLIDLDDDHGHGHGHDDD